jgi:chromate transporter
MWCTFVPPFIWIFLGVPYIEALSGNKALSAALSAITAAVVGIILNLAVWFALHVLFKSVMDVHWSAVTVSIPVLASVSWPALVLSLAAMIATFRFKAGMIQVFAACSLAGALYYLVAGAP